MARVRIVPGAAVRNYVRPAVEELRGEISTPSCWPRRVSPVSRRVSTSTHECWPAGSRPRIRWTC
ncbi:hypothetical protein ACQPZA_23410 [Pseudonocardia xinjiangensis]|uniref:hypothetical protein n=1 Tax=Pseudonocardia xinjiangensis TaxID=75289 RepID=UPI003D901270